MFIQGQKVVCIDAEFSAQIQALYAELPKLNQVYTVRTIGMGLGQPKLTKAKGGKISASGEEDLYVLLHEVVNPPDPFNKHGLELGFSAWRFRPLDELSEAEILEIALPEAVPVPTPPTKKPELVPA